MRKRQETSQVSRRVGGPAKSQGQGLSNHSAMVAPGSCAATEASEGIKCSTWGGAQESCMQRASTHTCLRLHPPNLKMCMQASIKE